MFQRRKNVGLIINVSEVILHFLKKAGNIKTSCGILFLILISACDNDHTSGRYDSEISPSGFNEGETTPDSIYEYVAAAIDTMQKWSIRKDAVDWEQLKAQTLEKAAGAIRYEQSYPAIKEALVALEDNHSFFKTPEQHEQWIRAAENQGNKFKFPEGRMRENSLAVVTLYSFSSGDSLQKLEYVSHLHQIIEKLDSENPSGWIVDLMYNRGGNMWPMLVGMGPLIGEGILGHFLDANGNSVPWRYTNGEARMGDKIMMEIPNPYKVKNSDKPVAVLISDRTASSGEAILVSFIGRPNTKIFGSSTAGLSTANRQFTLADGAQLILTSAIFTDRRGKIYGDKIFPDVDLSDKWFYFYGHEFYYAKEAAKDWILNQSGSTAKY